MEGMVAKWYAANTGKSFDEFTRLAQRIGAQLPRGSTVLEVAPGPGYFCIELAKLGPYSITGPDISHTFVELVVKKAAEAGAQVDFLLCRAAFKNFAEPVRALQEMRRVLKPGGRGLIIDLRRDASPESINRHVDGMGLSAVNRLLTKLAFRTMLLKSAYTREQFQYMLSQAGFRSVDIHADDIGFEISMTKAQPPATSH